MAATGTVCLILALVQGGWGQFQLSFGTQGPPAPTVAPGGFDPNCKDKLDNCNMFGADSCGGQYAAWAKDNCALTCKFCTGPPTSPPPCVDVLDNCASYESGACTDPAYASWAKANCRRTCRLCPAEVLAQLDALTTTIPPSQCVDKVDCRLYTKSACNGSFEPWAKENCANFCGFCRGAATTPKPCLDSRPNCNMYEKDMCTNPSYKIWVDDNCPQYCGRCSALPTTEPPCQDSRLNCKDYDKDICTDDHYRTWAEKNCRKFCDFCAGPASTTAAGGTQMKTPPPIGHFPTPPPLPGKK